MKEKCFYCNSSKKRTANQAFAIVAGKPVCRKHKNKGASQNSLLKNKHELKPKYVTLKNVSESGVISWDEIEIKGSIMSIRSSSETLFEKYFIKKREICFRNIEEANEFIGIYNLIVEQKRIFNIEAFFYQNASDKTNFMNLVTELEQFELLGSGSTRKVYDLKNGKVVKLALNQEGVWANESEINTKLSDSMVEKAEPYEVNNRAIIMNKIDVPDIYEDEDKYLDYWEAFCEKYGIETYDDHKKDITDGGQVGMTKEGKYKLFDYSLFPCPQCNILLGGVRYGEFCSEC